MALQPYHNYNPGSGVVQLVRGIVHAVGEDNIRSALSFLPARPSYYNKRYRDQIAETTVPPSKKYKNQNNQLTYRKGRHHQYNKDQVTTVLNGYYKKKKFYKKKKGLWK